MCSLRQMGPTIITPFTTTCTIYQSYALSLLCFLLFLSSFLSLLYSLISHLLLSHLTCSAFSLLSSSHPPNMAAFALSLLLLAFMTPSPTSCMSWCVCKDGSDATLQKTLDYACGAGGDCNPLRQNGPCFQPNTVKAHCSYAVNSFYQKKGQAPMSCDFSGTATVTSTNPSSSSGCAYPSSASTIGTSTTPVSTTPTMGTNSSTGTTPHGTTPGVLGGIGTGMGPSGSGNDESHGGLRLLHTTFLSPFSIVLFSGFIICFGGVEKTK
ncbi:hypothetical protein Lal_00006243 [Lupinus albus]|uniref:Putative X8 domain-containing protein n=1 Tax=Lupinus albus TaxID=3870 RepID=A0A6A4Q7A1_LUPAL|nr:putative X8 domain-containing protein [Lupinus albus]KAF1875613.1 hypothetical protein Lal_00006243 [Lupinus albus]